MKVFTLIISLAIGLAATFSGHNMVSAKGTDELVNDQVRTPAQSAKKASDSADAPQDAEAELAKKVDKIASQTIGIGQAVGLSIVIAQGDKTLLAKGYGLADLESQTPATADTVYRIGSITKQFTAAAIFQLIEKGKIALNDPIVKHLPKFPPSDPPITVRHLLQHTSGLKSFTSLPNYRPQMRKDATHEEMVARFKDLPPNFPPGQRYRYCNSGYYLLGMIVESASGESYQDYLNKHLFQPLDMKQSFYDTSAAIIPNRARGYRRSYGIVGGYRNAAYLSMTQPFAAGAIASSAKDLLVWHRGLTQGKILKPESYQQMATRGVLNDGREIPYGFGLAIRRSGGREAIGHGGGINGFRSDITHFPKNKLTIVVLANSENSRPSGITRSIAALFFESEKGEPNGADITKTEANITKQGEQKAASKTKPAPSNTPAAAKEKQSPKPTT